MKRATLLLKHVFFFTVLMNAMTVSNVLAQQKIKTYHKIPLLQLQDTAFHCIVIGKEVYLDGDIYLGDTTALNRLQNLAFASVIDDNWLRQTRWINSMVPVEIDNDFFVSERNTIIESLNEIMAATNIAFKIRTTETDFVYYKKVTVDDLGFSGGSSPVGRINGRQIINVSLPSKKIIKHETLHSLGFFHEQSRFDRDDFVNIFFDNMVSELAKTQFKKHDFWDFAKDIGDYDFKSIMHYGERDFGIVENRIARITIARKHPTSDPALGSNILSSADIAAINIMYPVVGSPHRSIPLLPPDFFAENQSWTINAYYGTKGTYFADVTGDRRADAIVINNDGITVRRSTGTSFSPNQSWTSTSFFGNKSTHFADVTGDGRADVIGVSVQGTYVRRSNGRTFDNAETWFTGLLEETKGVFFADVNGDGKADAISVGTTGINVRLSTGSTFSAAQAWTTNAYYGTRGTFFADVTGDGKADAIVVNDFGVTVRRSTGTNFSDNETWTSNPYYGTRGTFFADVTGDGKADAIVVNDFGVTIRRSTGTNFSANETGTSNPYYAERGMFFADIKNAGKCAAIVVNNSNIIARPAN